MKNWESISPDLRQYVPAPAVDDLFSQYLFKIDNQHEHNRGIAWFATIKNMDSQTVCKVRNMGEGGCHNYEIVDQNLFDKFVEDARATYPNEREPEDNFVALLDIWEASDGYIYR